MDEQLRLCLAKVINNPLELLHHNVFFYTGFILGVKLRVACPHDIKIIFIRWNNIVFSFFERLVQPSEDQNGKFAVL